MKVEMAWSTEYHLIMTFQMQIFFNCTIGFIVFGALLVLLDACFKATQFMWLFWTSLHSFTIIVFENIVVV